MINPEQAHESQGTTLLICLPPRKLGAEAMGCFIEKLLNPFLQEAIL